MSKLSRSSSPYENSYETYENTRLNTEYNPHNPPAPPKPSEKSSVNPRTDRLISRIRLILRILSFLISCTIVATLGYTVWLYRSTSGKTVEETQTKATLRVWLGNLKTQPSYVLLAVSCVATALSFTLIIASFSKIVRRVTNVGNLVTVIVSSIGAMLWLGVGVWYKRDDWDEKSHMDITSYVCRHQHNEALRHELGNMGALCGGLRYAWWAVLVASSIELLSIATVGWGVLVARKNGAYSKI